MGPSGAVSQIEGLRPKHSDHPRGRGRVRQTGSAVFDRQGLFRAAAAGAEGFRAWEASVSAAARRHQLQVPRDDRLSRRHGRAIGAELIVHTNRQALEEGRRTRSGWGPPSAAPSLRPRRCLRPSKKTASTPRSAARGAKRNGRAPRSGFIPFAIPTVNGIRRISGRNCGTCSTGG